MNYTLSYVNMPDDLTHNLDHEFDSLVALMRVVEQNYAGYTSYQIIVVRRAQPEL